MGEEGELHRRALLTLEELGETFEEYMELTGLAGIIRRYFVMNAFDGILTMLGFVLGSYFAGVKEAGVVIGAGVSATIAMGLSGFVGALITEKAEQERKVRELEKAMLAKLDNSVIKDAALMATVLAGVVDGSAPAIGALLVAIPFLFSEWGYFDFTTAVIYSSAMAFVTLFTLGLYLGRISKGNMIKYGIMMLGIGALLATILSLMGGIV